MNLEELIIPLKVNDMASSGLKSIQSGLSSLNLGFIAIGAVITATVGLMAGAVKATFNWAEELDHLQDVTGVTNKQAAALNFVLRKSGVGTETLTKGMVILEKGLVKVDGSLDVTGEKLKDYGINVLDANGKVKDQASLLNDIASKYNSFATQQERVNFLTDVFGKSGANLVDFFDTLAKEGGIDAVTKKVEDFGLAIDPARYENFTRSLEEIKLMALGIAVQFTERLMPALEGFLGWIESLRGKSPADLLQSFEDSFALLTLKFQNWAARIDWNQVSQDLINGIKSVDWANLGNVVRVGFGNIFSGLGTVIEGIDWKGIFSTAGIAFLDFMAGLTNQGSWDNVKTTWNNNLTQLKNIVSTMMENIFKSVRDWVDSIIEQLKSIPDWVGLELKTSTYRPPGRASGGPVIAGQSYSVAEFSKPEVFTPNVNGRIDAKNSTAQMDIDYDEMGRAIVKYLIPGLQTIGVG